MNSNSDQLPRRRPLVIGVAIVAAAVIAAAAWKGGNSTKRTAGTPAVAAHPVAPKLPPPPAQETEGATSAELTLAPQPAPLTAWVTGSTHALLDEGGSLEIVVSADGKPCNGKRYFREPPMGPGYTLSMSCEVNVNAGVAAVFAARVAVDKGSVTESLKLRVRYER